jgi:hypothetical protein
MVKDALGRGYAAVAIQATNPLQALFTCQNHGIRAILNHRLKADSGAGHYTVLTGFEADGVLVHDPYFGPDHRIAFSDLLDLWQPKYTSSEIVGNVLIGIATPAADPRKCRGCGLEVPPVVPCPKCDADVPLSPAPLLGCIGERCIFRGWNYVCCPACDFTWSFTARPAEPGKSPGEGPWNLGGFFAELDKFEANVRADKSAMRRKDVQEQLQTIRENREKLRLAEYEEKSRAVRAEAQVKEYAGTVAKEEADLARAAEAAAKPAPPIDAARLGDALLKDLGIVKG